MNSKPSNSSKSGVKKKPSALSAAVNKLMDSTQGPGDERERAIAAKASSFGVVMGVYVGLLAALITAIFGSLLVPVIVFILLAVSSWSAIWYAHHHHVDLHALVSQAGAFAKASAFAVVAAGFLLTLGAMAVTVFTGHPLIELPAAELTGPNATGTGASFVRGAIIGGFIGCIGGLGALLVSIKKPARD